MIDQENFEAVPAEIQALRQDGFVDLIKGFGQVDKPWYDREAKVSAWSYEALYDQDWLARAIVEKTPSLALRKGIEFDNDETEDLFEDLNEDPEVPEGLFLQALYWGRLHGGAALIVLPDKGDPAEPFREGDGARSFVVVKWDGLSVLRRGVDPNEARLYGKPEIYSLSNGVWKNLKIHASRIVLCEGKQSANRAATGRPWVSVLAPCYATLADYGFSWESVSHLIKESSLLILKMAGLHGALGTGANEIAKNRMRAMNAGKSVFKTLFLDPSMNEAAERLSVSFADLPQLMIELSKRLAGAAETPMTILYGISPAGLNATGESDIRQYYDSLESYRNKNLKRKLQRIGLLISGRRVEVKFPNLWSPTAVEQADLRTKLLAGDRTLWEMEAVDPLRVLLSRAQDGTLGLDLPEPLIARLEQTLAKSGEGEARPSKPEQTKLPPIPGFPSPEPNVEDPTGGS